MSTLLLKAFFIHWVADFLLQSRKVANNKSKSLKYLSIHIAIIFVVFYLFFGFTIALYNALIHFCIDACIWNLYKYSVVKRFPNAKEDSYKYWEDSFFYVTIGLDQLLHYATIVYLFEALL